MTSRSSVRKYGNETVSGDEMTYVLDGASTVPSAGNLELGDVVILTDEEEERLALQDAACRQEHIGQTPAVIVVCPNYIRSMSQYGDRGILYAVQDATIACTFLMLAAHAIGINSCWTGAFVEEDARIILPSATRAPYRTTRSRERDDVGITYRTHSSCMICP